MSLTRFGEPPLCGSARWSGADLLARLGKVEGFYSLTIVRRRGCSHVRVVVAPETDARWRDAILQGEPSLFSLRYNIDESSINGELLLVTLVAQRRSVKVFKINRESVRGLWAAQQQEVGFGRAAQIPALGSPLLPAEAVETEPLVCPAPRLTACLILAPTGTVPEKSGSRERLYSKRQVCDEKPHQPVV